MKNSEQIAVFDPIIKDPRLCVGANLRKAMRVVTQLYDEALKPSGIRSTQSSVLTVLLLAGPLSISELAQELVMDRTTLARNIKPLEAQGLLQVMAGEDQRMRIVQLAPAGRAVMEIAMPLREQVQARLVEELGREKVCALLGYLTDTISLTQEGNVQSTAAQDE